MKIELKNLKVYPRLSEETTAFTATVYADGKKVGEAKNDGHGGCNIYYWTNAELGRKVLEWAKAQPLEFDFEHLDQILDKTIDKQELLQKMKRSCRKKLLFRLKGDARGSWRTLNANDAKAREWVKAKYGDKIECVANDNLEAALEYC